MGSKVTSLLNLNRGSNFDSLQVGYLTLYSTLYLASCRNGKINCRQSPQVIGGSNYDSLLVGASMFLEHLATRF